MSSGDSNSYPPDDSLPTHQNPRPTWVRYGVLLFLCTMAFVLYLDRVCISVAVTPIQKELGLSKSQMSYVLMAFTLAYGLFELPTGHWGDRFGSRRILTRIVIWWSTFTALTAACVGLRSLVVVRFLFGAGEAGAYPNAARVISRWFPRTERGRVQGFFQAASLPGGALAPAIAAYLIADFGWRLPFLIFGAVGVIWAIAFYACFRDEPTDHPSVNEAEAQLLEECRVVSHDEQQRLPVFDVLTHPTIWLLGLLTTCSAFNTYFYFSWYPTYLKEARLVAPEIAGVLASIVLFGGMVGTLVGGVLVDHVVRRYGDAVFARRLIASGSYFLAAILLVSSLNFDSPWIAALFSSGSVLALYIQQTVWWSAATQVSGRYLGALFGLMNGLGTFGAMGSQGFVGFFADWRKSQGFVGREQWDPIFYVYASVLLFGTIIWWFISPTEVVGARRQRDLD
jgi:ACS family glucarate transporter-like MFS transporter